MDERHGRFRGILDGLTDLVGSNGTAAGRIDIDENGIDARIFFRILQEFGDIPRSAATIGPTTTFDRDRPSDRDDCHIAKLGSTNERTGNAGEQETHQCETEEDHDDREPWTTFRRGFLRQLCSP